jgi:hypothetical protein
MVKWKESTKWLIIISLKLVMNYIVKISEQDLIHILSENNLDMEGVQGEINGGKRVEVSGDYLFEKSPLYGIRVNLDAMQKKLSIQIMESLDANYLMHEKRCELVVNFKEYAYQMIEIHKLMGRYDKDVSITEVRV